MFMASHSPLDPKTEGPVILASFMKCPLRKSTCFLETSLQLGSFLLRYSNSNYKVEPELAQPLKKSCLRTVTRKGHVPT